MTRVEERTAAEAKKPVRRRKNAVIERLEYSLYRAISFPVRRASTPAIERWSGRIARLAPRLLRGRQELVLRNLRRSFPEKSEEDRREIARRCWEHFAGMVLRFIRRTGGRGRPAFDIRGREHVERLLARGKGIVMVTAHYGDWEAAISAFTEVTVPVVVVARRLDNRMLERDLYSERLQSNVEVVDRRRAARPLLRTIEAGGIVVLLVDQAVKPREGVLVPFLGRPAWTTPAAARLVLRSGAGLLFVFCEPKGAEEVLIEMTTPILGDELTPEEATVEALTERVNQVISDRIRQAPHLWLWMHDRWKGANAPASKR
jgi:Kdo2-lipid IVA lauroyltransferase/acyltransferase